MMSTITMESSAPAPSITTSSPYMREHEIASLAVQRAFVVAKRVLSCLDRGKLAKADDSPVSLADFASQALIVAALHEVFPEDIIVGEENAASLRSNTRLANSVWDLVQEAKLDDAEAEEQLAKPSSKEEMLDLIDLAGNSSPQPYTRVWFLDPIDGTKTYLEGTHYCVVASLIDDGKQVLATFACPHLFPRPREGSARPSISEAESDVDKSEGAGYIVSTISGQGVYVRPLRTGALAKIEQIHERKHVNDIKELVFAESTEYCTPQFQERHLIAEELGVPWPPTGPVRIFSTQLRYVALALGACDVTLRAPLSLDKQPYCWDHAGGIAMYEELGGKVTDLRGKPIDMTVGRKLMGNYGIVAAPANFHGEVLSACRKVLRKYDSFERLIDRLGNN